MSDFSLALAVSVTVSTVTMVLAMIYAHRRVSQLNQLIVTKVVEPVNRSNEAAAKMLADHAIRIRHIEYWQGKNPEKGDLQ